MGELLNIFGTVGDALEKLGDVVGTAAEAAEVAGDVVEAAEPVVGLASAVLKDQGNVNLGPFRNRTDYGLPESRDTPTGKNSNLESTAGDVVTIAGRIPASNGTFQDIHIRGLLPNEFDFSVAGNYADIGEESFTAEALWALGTGRKVRKAVTTLFKAGWKRKAGEWVANEFEKAGKRLRNLGLSADRFGAAYIGVNPVSFSLDLRFFKYSEEVSAYEAAYLPVMALVALSIPVGLSRGNERDVPSTVVDLQAPEPLTVRVGNLITFPEVHLLGVTPRFGNTYEEVNGVTTYPTIGYATVRFRTAKVLILNDLVDGMGHVTKGVKSG